jgi:hypothetical protein
MERFIEILAIIVTLLLIILAAINVSYAAIFALVIFVVLASTFFAWGKKNYIDWTIYGSVATTFLVFIVLTIASFLGFIMRIDAIVPAVGGAISPAITACAYIELKQ